MAEVRACAKALVRRVSEGGEIPIASLRELGDLVLRSVLVAVSDQVLEGPPEFALRRCLVGAPLKSTVDAQALTEVARVHANLDRIGGLLKLACKLVDAVQVQNTRAGRKRTYHLVISVHPEDRRLRRAELEQAVDRLVDTLGISEHQYVVVRHSDTDHEHIHVAINKIHPETFRIHSPAWDHQRLFTGARALERELGLTPLRSRTRERENVPQRAADCEAHHGVDSFARWAREELRPALRATELRSWDDVHDLCGRFGVVIRLHGKGFVFEEVERGVRVKASFVARELSKTRPCKRLGAFQSVSERQREAAQRAPHPYSPMPARAPRASGRSTKTASSKREQLKRKYHLQRSVIVALPVAGSDRKQLLRQLALRKTIETRALKRKLAVQRSAIQKTWHPGTWRHFVASRAAERDARAIRLLRQREPERGRCNEERKL